MMDEAAWTTDSLGSVDHDGPPEAQPSAESNPPRAAAAADDVELVVSAPIQKDIRERLKQAQRETNNTMQPHSTSKAQDASNKLCIVTILAFFSPFFGLFSAENPSILNLN